MIYLASPFWHENPVVRQLRVKANAEACSKLYQEGYLIYSPLCHNDMIANLLPHWDNARWIEWTGRAMRHCDEVFLLPLPGWDASKGVESEYKDAARRNMPWTPLFLPRYVKPKTLEQIKSEMGHG